jgi:hypothetical protein
LIVDRAEDSICRGFLCPAAFDGHKNRERDLSTKRQGAVFKVSFCSGEVNTIHRPRRNEMKLRDVLALGVLALAVPSLSYAGQNWSTHPTKAGVATDTYIYGGSAAYGAYFKIYANGTYLCTTNAAATTPIWHCVATIANPGNYQLSAVVYNANGVTPPQTIPITVSL